jgi:hypothetical protein
MSAVLAKAIEYTERGWFTVPVPHQRKNPGFEGWQNLRITEATVPEHFNGKAQNIGLILGEASHGLIDVDVDCLEALQLTNWLPATGRVSGRASKPRSHWWYSVPGLRTKQYRDTTKDEHGKTAMLIELRSTGGQTIVPPSVHESTGEEIVWHLEEEVATVDGQVLQTAVAHIAAAALLARHWPGEGTRHHASLALAGMLVRAGWSEQEVAEFVRGVAYAAGDTEWSQREKNVMTTARAVASGQKATGTPTLITLLERADGVIERVREWLNLPTSTQQPSTPEPREWPEPPGEMAFAGLAGRIVAAADPQYRSRSGGGAWAVPDGIRLRSWAGSTYVGRSNPPHAATVSRAGRAHRQGAQG